MRMRRNVPAWAWGAPGRRWIAFVAGVVGPVAGWAQTVDGATGINQANTMIRGYFDPAANLMYAIGAVVGIAGAIRVHKKWSEGDHDTQKTAIAWFGSCIFLVVVATVLKSFFGI